MGCKRVTDSHLTVGGKDGAMHHCYNLFISFITVASSAYICRTAVHKTGIVCVQLTKSPSRNILVVWYCIH